MIFGKTKLELKVGIFVFIGFVILATFILSIGGFKTWSSGYKINCIFNFVNGVKLGAPVRVAGVDVGVVKKIDFMSCHEGRQKIKITCWLRKDVFIPVDSQVWVNTLGLLGEKYIEIMPGKNYASCLGHKQEIVGNDPMATQEMGELLKGIGNNLGAILNKVESGEGTLGMFINDGTLYNELEAFVADIRKNPWKLFFRAKEVK
ncbi:MAG: MlaD family protein [Candidatus Omnitrophica bacterium]|jgi:phospholipid/cholesterol/gamma-HCH transport system substrate-binding protein|nr:MlaD family protein [Candidatus Omnitrophota bacterium]